MEEGHKGEKYNLLVALFAIGITLFGLQVVLRVFIGLELCYTINLLLWPVVIISAILVAIDAKELGAGRNFQEVYTLKTLSWGPGTWAVMVFFLWIICMPLYLAKRSKIAAQAPMYPVVPPPMMAQTFVQSVSCHSCRNGFSVSRTAGPVQVRCPYCGTAGILQ